MQGNVFASSAMKKITIAAMLAALALPLSARAEDSTPTCNTPLDLVRLNNPLTRFGHKLTSGEPVTIVAIGSSSTAGAGASSPAKSYPSQLAIELQKYFPNPISVINRGANGEEVADMLKRFDQVIDAKPDLVLWQFGTNSLIRDHKFTDHRAMIHEGLSRIRAVGADVVVIDPQFVPKVLVKPEAEHMVEFIATTTKLENVDLFHRFGVMKHWRDVDHLPFESFVSLDGLHMNDWSYGCMAKGLAMAIVDAAERPIMSATAMSHLLP